MCAHLQCLSPGILWKFRILFSFFCCCIIFWSECHYQSNQCRTIIRTYWQPNLEHSKHSIKMRATEVWAQDPYRRVGCAILRCFFVCLAECGVIESLANASSTHLRSLTVCKHCCDYEWLSKQPQQRQQRHFLLHNIFDRIRVACSRRACVCTWVNNSFEPVRFIGDLSCEACSITGSVVSGA